MKAVVMAGGLGTRLRPLTYLLPKPMVPVFNRPVLEHTLAWLKQAGIRDVVMLLYYMPDVIKEHFGDGDNFGVRIAYVEAKQDFSTAGAVRLASALIEAPFLVVSGDVICDLAIPELIDFHLSHAGLATLALTAVPDPTPFGIVDVDADGRVRRFTEKPEPEQVFSNLVNMGIYILHPDILAYIPPKCKYYFARDLFPKLLEQGVPVFGFKTDGYWLDIGNIQAYKKAQQDAIQERILLQPLQPFETGVSIGKNCTVSDRVNFEGKVVIGNDCRIDDNVVLTDTVIGNGCSINAGVQLKNCTIWNGLEIKQNSKFSSAVLTSYSDEI